MCCGDCSDGRFDTDELWALNSRFYVSSFPTLEGQLGKIFPELVNQRETILRALRSEEESFSKTLDRGLARFQAVTDALPAEGVFPRG